MNKILFLCFPEEFRSSPTAQQSLSSLKNKSLSLSFDQGSNYYKTQDKARTNKTSEAYPHFTHVALHKDTGLPET